MARQEIFLGTIAGDHTGTKMRLGGDMINDNFIELYAAGLLNDAKLTNATHTGDVTGSGPLTIADKAVTLAKMYDMATASLIYRRTAGVGSPEVNTLAQLAADLGLVGTPLRTYEGTLNHTGGARQQKVLTGVTTKPFTIMIVDPSGYAYSPEAFECELTTVGPDYALNLYSVEAIILEIRVTW